jgi:hypothetical protein
MCGKLVRMLNPLKVLKITIFWDVMQYSLLEIYQHSEGTHCLQPQMDYTTTHPTLNASVNCTLPALAATFKWQQHPATAALLYFHIIFSVYQQIKHILWLQKDRRMAHSYTPLVTSQNTSTI